MSGYDRWLEAPYANQPEQIVCEECCGEGTNQPPPGFPPEKCERCDGTGYVDPPTPAEIREEKAEIDADRRLSEGDY